MGWGATWAKGIPLTHVTHLILFGDGTLPLPSVGALSLVGKGSYYRQTPRTTALPCHSHFV